MSYPVWRQVFLKSPARQMIYMKCHLIFSEKDAYGKHLVYYEVTLVIANHEVPGLNPAASGIQLMTVLCFIA